MSSSAHRLRVLGSPAVLTGAGEDVELPLGKPLAALCLVALESTRVTRDDLAAFLWPGVSRDRARASVRQALWLLKKGIDAEVVEERDGALHLADMVKTDLEELEADLVAGRLVDAWTAWKGGPLRGLSVADAPRWNAWAERLRGEWERRFGEALEIQAASQDGEARVTWLRRALRVRPYRASVHAALVETFIHQRRTEEAEAALHEARTLVDDATPGLFDDLAERLRALRRERFLDADDSLRFEFVGRATEFSALTTLWRSALSGRPRMAAALGPAGIGKTRLVEQFVELAEAEGARVVEVKGVGSESAVELGTIASLTKSLLHLPGAAGISSGSAHALRALVPSEDRTGGPPTTVVGTAGVGDALSDLVSAVSHEAPLLLRVEDVHWIDRASTALLLRLVRGLCRVPVLLLMTCRTEERDVAVLRSLRRLEQAGQASLLPLGPLSRSEVAEMLGLMFSFATDAAADECTERLHRASGGNPLFLQELLHHLRDRGLVVEEDARGETEWPARSLRLPDELELPRTVREALARRMAGLGEDARALAGVLARSKSPLGTRELARKGGLGESRFTRALGELLNRDVVRWTRSDLLEIGHDCLRRSLSSDPTGSWDVDRRRLHWAGWSVGVAAVAALLFLAVGQPGAAAPEAPFGGGILFKDRGDHMVAYRFLSTASGGLELEPVDTVPIPAGVSVTGTPAPSKAGSWIVPGIGVSAEDRAPDAWVVEDGEPRAVWAKPGDDRLSGIGPNGDQYLVGTEDLDAPHFRMNLLRLDPRSGATTLLVEGSGTGEWARDGSFIVASIRSSVDSVAVVQPDGTRLHTLAAPEGRLLGARWCDGRGVVLAMSISPGEMARAWTWRPGEAEVEPLELRYPPRWLQCSPDGSVVAYGGWVDRTTALVVEEIDGEGIWVLDGTDDWVRSHWLAPGPRPAPRGVEIEPDSLLLMRGQRSRLTAVVEGAPDLPPRRGAWTSSDPLTVFVSDGGQLVGNGPGRAVVRYVVDGWLTDSVAVRVVQKGTGAELRFSDALTDVDEGTWRVEGFPTPAPTLDEQGRPVLSMNGDGRFWDGMISEAAFDLSGGATAEVDFRLPLTRIDRQQFGFCLLRGKALPEGTRPSLDWRVEERVCARWPAHELEDFDPDEVSFASTGPLWGAVSVAGTLRESEWNRASIQLQADGRAMLYLNETHVATIPWRIDLADKVWHLAIHGRAADTELWVRNAALWAEPRYGVPQEAR